MFIFNIYSVRFCKTICGNTKTQISICFSFWAFLTTHNMKLFMNFVLALFKMSHHKIYLFHSKHPSAIIIYDLEIINFLF